jgi:predicted alpha/beta hydrolase family esterase
VTSIGIETVGSGSREIYVVPGVVDAPGDWDVLARESEATLRVIRKPLPNKGKQDSAAWRKEWHNALSQLLPDAETIIAHSAGGLDVLHVAGDFRMKLLVLLSPPTAESFSALAMAQAENAWNDPNERLAHELLAPLCPNMDPEIYAALVRRHARHYGSLLSSTLKRERPNDLTITVEQGRELLTASPSPVIIVDGMHDPWSQRQRRDQMTEEFNHVVVREIESGHFPHVGSPKRIADFLHAAAGKLKKLS